MQAVDLEAVFYRLLMQCGEKTQCKMDIADLKAYSDILSVHGFELANQAIYQVLDELDHSQAFPSVFYIRSKIEEIKRRS